jgi:hypothetical protein
MTLAAVWAKATRGSAKPHGPGDAFRLGNVIAGTEDDDPPGGLTHRGVDDAGDSLILRMIDADDRDIGREVPQGFARSSGEFRPARRRR